MLSPILTPHRIESTTSRSSLATQFHDPISQDLFEPTKPQAQTLTSEYDHYILFTFLCHMFLNWSIEVHDSQ